ncbi:MAG: pantoate--beta-alanine ligase [Gemmatimonadales bacterium]|nr:MAG: pantoate--beta-alanine ligase [Gemmatimonadales bacterium]
MTASPSPEVPVLLRTRRELRAHLDQVRAAGRSIGLVPTMGYLHEGHLSLVDRALEEADHALLSIFVNPLQFAPGEDLDRYPRDLEGDLRKAGARGVHAVFAPSREEMYPGGEPVLRISPGPMGTHLCGRSRPTHFPGVLTVVCRLFGLVRPQVAVFGRKDLQQSLLVRRMVRDLELGVAVEVVAPVRESDGLALSSRNAYLAPEDRARAPELQRALEAARQRWQAGETDARRLVEGVRAHLDGVEGLEVDYVELVDTDLLQPVEEAREGHALAGAIHLGPTRLIDNVLLRPEPDPRPAGAHARSDEVSEQRSGRVGGAEARSGDDSGARSVDVARAHAGEGLPGGRG